jgi:predicted site-specific integrase-resolvase
MDTHSDFLTVPAAAEHLGVSRQLVYRMCKTGLMRWRRIDGRMVVYAIDVERRAQQNAKRDVARAMRSLGID